LPSEPAEFDIPAIEEAEWTTQLVATFPLIRVNDGLLITANLDLGDIQRSATIKFEAQNV